MIRMFIVFFAMIIVSGCFETKQTETKPVSWYKENPVKRKEKLIECNENPGNLEKTPNCINAKRAEMESLSKGQNTRF